jgi:putative addiction module antidote
MKTKLRKIGSGYGVLLPKKVIDNLRLSEGDELELTESEAAIELSPFDPDFADQVEAFRRTEAQHRNSYRELGKRQGKSAKG